MEIDTTYNVNCFDFFSTMEDKSVDYDTREYVTMW